MSAHSTLSSPVAVSHSTCRICGAVFEVDEVDMEVLRIFGRTLQANVCDACGEQRKAPPPPPDLTEIRNARWREMVGTYYDNFREDLLPPRIRPHVADVLKWKVDPVGIGLKGATYTGKSRLLHELGRKLYVSGTDVFPTSGIEFQDMVVAQVNDRESFESYMRRAKTCEVLLLDDADKLKLTEAVEAAYYALFEERRRFQRPALVTVNVAGVEMGGSVNRGPAIVSRLRDLCRFIQV